MPYSGGILSELRASGKREQSNSSLSDFTDPDANNSIYNQLTMSSRKQQNQQNNQYQPYNQYNNQSQYSQFNNTSIIDDDESYIVEMFGKRGWVCESCNNFNYESK
jgi:hypothetical protein